MSLSMDHVRRMKRRWRLKPGTAEVESTLGCADFRTDMTAWSKALLHFPKCHLPHCAPIWGNTNGWGLDQQRGWQTFGQKCQKGRRTWKSRPGESFQKDGVKCFTETTRKEAERCPLIFAVNITGDLQKSHSVEEVEAGARLPGTEA